MRTRSASANSGAQRVVDDIKEEPTDDLAQVDSDFEPLNDGTDNNQINIHAATESIDEQLDTFVSRMITRSARLNARRTTSPPTTTTPEPEIHTPTTTSRVTRRSTRTATPTATTTTTATGRVTKASSSSIKTNKPLPPIPAILPSVPNTPRASTDPSTSSSKPPTSLFRTLSPAQRSTRKRKLSTIKSTLKRKSVEQLTDLYNSTEDPDFQTLMTEVYHENCMSRLEGWERSLTDE